MTPAAVAERPVINIECMEWEEPLYQPFRYKVLYGGRASGKTWAAAKALIIQSLQERHIIYCVREHLKSLGLSAKQALEGWIHRLGLDEWFNITQAQITCIPTGSVFFFHGLSTVSEEDIKGWEGVTRCWAEEAHTMSARSRALLYPTIFRQRNSEFWATFNPRYRYDPIYEDFVHPGNWGKNNRYVKKVNFYDNPWFPEGEEELRREWKANNPLTYPHEWLGEPDDAGSEQKVLPYMLLEKCVDAWNLRPERGVFGTAGFDVADTGADYNALALRFGPELFYAERWHGTEEFTISHSTRKAARLCDDNGIGWLNYDEGGVGRGVRGPAMEWKRDTSESLKVNGCGMGNEVQGKGVIFDLRRPRSITNEQYFRNWGSQAAMVLVIRAQNTERLLAGDKVDPHKCLYINPDIPYLSDVLSDMSVAEWDDKSGKYRVEKQPRKAGAQPPPSPDFFDAGRLAYGYDARGGLKARN